MFPDFSQYLTEQDCADLTISAYCNDIKVFARWFDETNGQALAPQLLTPTDLREYKQHLLIQKKARPATINRKLASIRMYVQWAIATGQIQYNPIAGIKGMAEQPLSPKWLSRIEQAALFREAEKRILSSRTPTRRLEAIRNKAILVLLINTGIRLGELCSLELSDFEMSERKGTLHIRNGKGGKSRNIPLNGQARKALNEWMGIRPQGSGTRLFVGMRGDLKPRAIQDMVREIGEGANIHVSPHSFRHSFGKNLVDSSQVSLDKVAALLGHSSLNVTRRYIMPSEQDLERAVGFLDE